MYCLPGNGTIPLACILPSIVLCISVIVLCIIVSVLYVLAASVLLSHTYRGGDEKDMLTALG